MSDIKKGTPTTLKQAIDNGLSHVALGDSRESELMAKIIEAHVIDYLAQSFGAAMLAAQGTEVQVIHELWSKIKNHKLSSVLRPS
jgi:hypothetical protein